MAARSMAMRWVQGLGSKTYGSIGVALCGVVIFSSMGFLPSEAPSYLKAVLSGIAFTLCLIVIFAGAKHVNRAYYAAAGLLASGLFLSIPSFFDPDSPVDWGWIVSLVGIITWVTRFVYELHQKHVESKVEE